MGRAQTAEEFGVAVDCEIVFVSGQEVVEVFEDLVAVAEPEIGSDFFRNVPRDLGLIRDPSLIERGLSQGGGGGWGGRAERGQQIARGGTNAIDLGEVAILGDAEGPIIKLVDDADMFGHVDGTFEIEHVGNLAGAAGSGIGVRRGWWCGFRGR